MNLVETLWGRQRRYASFACRPWVAPLLVALLGVVSATIAQGQQQDEPITLQFGQPEKRNLFSLDRPTGYLQLEATRNQTRSSSSTTSLNTTENDFRETLTLQDHGYIYHPNLIDLNLSGTFGLSQNRFTSSSTSTSSNSTVYAYDLDAEILRQRPLSFSLYAQRTDSWVNQDFGPTLENITDLYGARAEYRSKSLPIRAEVYHRELQLIDPLGQQGYRQTEDAQTLSAEWHITDRQSLSAAFSHTAVEEKPDQGSRDRFDVTNVSASHGISFDKEGNFTLSSTADYTTQGGTLPLRLLRVDENFNIRHSRDFQTYYRYTFTQQSRLNLDQTEHRGDIGFIHQLYESLSTSGEVGIDALDASSAELTHERYALLNTVYTKKIPYGLLTLDGNVRYSWLDTQAQNSAVDVISERNVFTDPQPIVLFQPTLEAGSIVVRDTSGFRVFRRGLDYTVLTFKDHIELRRVLGGAITDNEPVLLDYTLGPQGASNTDTLTWGVGARYEIRDGRLKGLAVYGRYSLQDQSISGPGASGLIPQTYHDFTYGAEYRFWRMTLKAEREQHESTVFAYDSTRLSADYNQALPYDLSLTANTTYNIINYSGEHDSLTYLSASASLDYQPTREWQATLTADYRTSHDSLLGNTTGFQQLFRVTWHHRRLQIFGEIRNVDLQTTHAKTSYQIFELSIRRYF